jgi:3-oxoadipate enol-lactonase
MKLAVDVPPAHPRLGAIRVPTTVLVGDRDNPSSVPFAKRIAAAVPGARLVNVPGADHLINLSRPEAFDRELAAALQSLG